MEKSEEKDGSVNQNNQQTIISQPAQPQPGGPQQSTLSSKLKGKKR